jgi:predicted Fe-Mo cluster-binding NifX family protein
MKIAITSSGRKQDSPMDARFGRAGYFLVFDTDSGEYEVIDNAAGRNSMQGAGVQAGELLSDRGVSALITGHCGPKAFRVLEAAGIKVMLKDGGTVEQAVEAYMSGGLETARGPDVESHWG